MVGRRARDAAGRTAYDYAQINGHLAARKLLRAQRLGRALRVPREMTPEEAKLLPQRVLWFGFDLTVVQALLANLAVGHLTTSLAPGATDNAMHLGGAVAGALFPRLLKFL